MADDAATRKRRSRAHRDGDHSLCLPGRCDSLLPPAVRDWDQQRQDDGGIESAVAAWAEALSFPPGDVRHMLVEATLKLARALDEAGPKDIPNVAREFRTYVAHLSDTEAEPGELDAIRARRAARRVDEVLRHARGAS